MTPLGLLVLVGVVLIAFGVVGIRLPMTAHSKARVPSMVVGQAADPGLTARLTTAINAYPRAQSIRVSVAVADYIVGAKAAFHPEQTFETASIVKVQVLATLLLRAQDSKRTLSTSERTLAQKMIVYSDNESTDTLWRLVGGAAAITTAVRRLGLTTTAPNREAWGKSTTTAADQLQIVRVLLEDGGPLNASSVAQARSLMGSVSADQKWGISASAAKGETVYVKNGWVTRDTDNQWIVHSVGEIKASGKAVGIVILSEGHVSLQAGITFVENIATLTRGCLSA